MTAYWCGSGAGVTVLVVGTDVTHTSRRGGAGCDAGGVGPEAVWLDGGGELGGCEAQVVRGGRGGCPVGDRKLGQNS